MSNFNPNQQPNAGRLTQTGIKLTMKGIAGNLAFASTITVTLLFGMVLALILALIRAEVI